MLVEFAPQGDGPLMVDVGAGSRLCGRVCQGSRRRVCGEDVLPSRLGTGELGGAAAGVSVGVSRLLVVVFGDSLFGA